MYHINAPVVYVHESIIKNEVWKKRMDRMMSAINTSKIETVNEKQLTELGFDADWKKHPPYRGIYSDMDDPVVIFDVYRWEDENQKWLFQRDVEKSLKEENTVCQNGYVLRFATGCFHKCAYCYLTRSIRIYLNIEEVLEHLQEHIKKNPSYNHYLSDGATDLICLEPEYGASEMMIRYFAQQDGRYMHITTKSNNVDFLLNLEHRGKTILSWTISPPRMAQLIERGVPSFEQRIEAMRKCQEAGYPVRCRFSPIIPLKNWEDDYRNMIKRLFQVVNPEFITLWVFSHTNLEDINSMFDSSLMVEKYIQAAAEHTQDLHNLQSAPFPTEVREEIYRFIINEIKHVSPDTRVSLCLETTDVWEHLSKNIGMTRERFFCNCGEKCTPGTDLYDEFVLKNNSVKKS